MTFAGNAHSIARGYVASDWQPAWWLLSFCYNWLEFSCSLAVFACQLIILPGRAKALAALINLSAIDPAAAHFSQPALLKCLAELRQHYDLASLVEHILHNVSNSPEQARLLRHYHMLPSSYREGKSAMSQVNRDMARPVDPTHAQKAIVQQPNARSHELGQSSRPAGSLTSSHGASSSGVESAYAHLRELQDQRHMEVYQAR